MERRRLLLTLLLCSGLAGGMLSFPANCAEAQRALPDGRVETPASSIARPEDAGSRAHTTIKLFIPTSGPANISPPSPLRAASLDELPRIPVSILGTRPLRSHVYIGWCRCRMRVAILMS